jgi:hypothetical protein
MIIVVGVCDSHKLSIKSFQIFVNDQGDCQIGNIATIYILINWSKDVNLVVRV